MSRKDVNLVVRAKDETSKAFNSIGKASEALISGFAEISKDGKNAQSTLALLGKALGDLDRTFKGMTGADRLGENLREAGDALGRLSDESASAKAKLDTLGRAQARVGDQSDRIAAKAQGAADALTKQGVAVDKAKDAARGYETALRGTERELAKLETRQRNVPGQIDKATVALEKSIARYDRYEKKVAETAKPSATLVGLLEKAGQSVVKNTEKLTGLSQSLNAVKADIAATNATVAAQAAAFDSANAGLSRQSAIYDKIKANTAGLAKDSKAASVAQSEVSKQFDAAAVSASRAAAAVDKAAVEYDQIAVATGKAEVALVQFANAGRDTLTKAVRQQGAALAEARRELQAQEGVVRDYAAALRATAEPTDRMVQNLTEARAAARQMRAEIAAQETAFRGMSGVLRQTGADYDSIANAQNRFQSIRGDTGSQITGIRGASSIAQDLEASREAAARAASDLQRARVAAGELAASFARVGPPTREQAEAMDAARLAVRAHKDAMTANGTAAAQLGAIYDRAGAGLITFAQAQRQAASVSASLGASLARIKAEAGTVATTTERVAAGTRSIGASSRKSAQDNDSLADSFRRLLGEQRQSLSLSGRIRAQVVQLTAAYVGLFGVFEGIRRTVDAFQTLEAATSRLTVVFQGDQGQVAANLDFIRRTADRLKLSFEGVADGYSKFAISTKGTNITTAQTQKIFTAVSEAARVYKLDQEQVNGVFTALGQIATKGKIQLEELTGQLGDRLPGALQVLAKGLGVTTEQLLEMTAKGQVSRDALVQFGEQLQKDVGPGLAAALKSTTAEFGAFQNNVFNGFLRLAQGGFIQAITRLMAEVNEQLTSPEFLSFIDRVSAGLSVLTDALTILVSNVRLVVVAFAGLFALKAAGWLGAAAAAFASLYVKLYNTIGAYRLLNVAARENAVAMGTTTTAATRASGAFRALGLSLRALGTATLLGAAFTAASMALAYFATSADRATEAAEKNREITDRIKNAYEASGGAIDKFRKSIDDLSVSQLNDNLTDMRGRLQDIREEATNAWAGLSELKARMSAFNAFTGSEAAQSQYQAIQKLNDEFAKGKPAKDYKDALDAIARSAETDALREYAVALQAGADAAIAAEEDVRNAERAIAAKTGTDEEATKALKELTGAVEDSAVAMAVKGAKATAEFEKALKQLGDYIPELKEKLDFEEQVRGLQRMRQELENFEGTAAQRIELARNIDQAQRNLNSEAAGQAFEAATGQTATAKSILAQANRFLGAREGNKELADFVLGQDPSKAIDPKLATAWCAAFVNAVLESQGIKTPGKANAKSYLGFGKEVTDGPRPGDVAVYNRGNKGWQGHVAIVESVNADGTVNIIGGNQSGPGSNGLSNMVSRQTRKASDAIAYRRPPTLAESAVEQQQEDEREEERAEAQAERDAERLRRDRERADERRAAFREDQDQRNTELQAEIAGEGILSREATIQAALAEREAAAKKAGGTLKPEDVALIKEATGAEYDRAAAKREEAAAAKSLQDAEQALASLETQRSELLNQRKLSQESGDTSGLAQIDAELATVNEKLAAAIAGMTALYQATGGSAADAGIAKLRTLSLEMQKQDDGAKKALISWQQVGELFGNGLVNAFDKFAQAVAKGENVGDAAREAFLQFASDFLRQIAQMILKWAIFNAIKSVFPGFSPVGVSHAGGMAGRSNRSREVSPMLFANAPRFHGGGLPGLKANEIPAILEEGEEVLSKESPRNIMNGGASAGGGAPAAAQAARVKIVNTFDGGSFLSEGLASTEGEQAFMNFVRANGAAIKGALG